MSYAERRVNERKIESKQKSKKLEGKTVKFHGENGLVILTVKRLKGHWVLAYPDDKHYLNRGGGYIYWSEDELAKKWGIIE